MVYRQGREGDMNVDGMVPVGTKVLDKGWYTWAGYLVDNAEGKHH